MERQETLKSSTFAYFRRASEHDLREQVNAYAANGRAGQNPGERDGPRPSRKHWRRGECRSSADDYASRHAPRRSVALAGAAQRKRLEKQGESENGAVEGGDVRSLPSAAPRGGGGGSAKVAGGREAAAVREAELPVGRQKTSVVSSRTARREV